MRKPFALFRYTRGFRSKSLWVRVRRYAKELEARRAAEILSSNHWGMGNVIRIEEAGAYIATYSHGKEDTNTWTT